MDNLDYLYNNFPARFRRDDKDLFLKRFLSFFGETADEFDYLFATFPDQINPETARIAFVEFWLRELFGWSWFPVWFSKAAKRQLYGNFAKHLARRGTARGIELWLNDFFIEAKVHKSPMFFGEGFFGEPLIFVSEPLTLIVEIGKVAPPNYIEDCSVFSESYFEECYPAESTPLYLLNEVENLLRYVQPQAQEIIIYRSYLGENNNE